MPATVKGQELLTLRECADELGVSKRRVQQFVEMDRLKATKIGYTYHVTRQELDRFKAIPRKTGNFTGLPRVHRVPKVGKLGGWGAYPGERSHYWNWSYRKIEVVDGKRVESDHGWKSFCAEASGGTDPYDDAPDEKPFPKRAGACYACFYFAKL